MTPESLAYVNSLVGKSWEIGAHGPEEFDCWGLVWAVQKNVFGRELPRVENPPTDNLRHLMKFIAVHPARKQWKVGQKHHGALVEMAYSDVTFHVGVFLDVDGGGIIHSQRRVGVCWDRESALLAAGWRKFVYHEWIG